LTSTRRTVETREYNHWNCCGSGSCTWPNSYIHAYNRVPGYPPKIDAEAIEKGFW